MGFWIFMLVMEMILPVMMLAFGIWFQKNPPKQINLIFGYRTKMSMKNMETWCCAHQYCGRMWYRAGCLMIPLTLLAMLPVKGGNEDVVGIFGSVWMVLQCMILIVLPIMRTERELRRKFDTDGKCRSS